MKTIFRVTRENEVLKGDVKQLRTELEEADSLLHQGESLTAFILDQDRCSGLRNLGSVIKRY